MSVLASTLELYNSQLFRIAVLVLFVLVSYLLVIRRQNLPPGPSGIPILGYLPFLSTNEPYVQLENFKRKYGNVFGMYLGSKFAVFLGDPSSCKEAYNMDVFSGRPEGALPMSKKCTHFAALSGKPWKNRRKLASKGLRQLGIGTHIIEIATRALISRALDQLEAEVAVSSNGEIDVSPIVIYTSTSVILYLVCGKTFPPDHPSYKTVAAFLRFFPENGSPLSLDICLPWSKPFLDFVSSYRKESTRVMDDMDAFARSEIQFHRDNPTETPSDMLDFYLQHYESEKDQLPISEISGDAQSIIVAGTDTIRAVTEWFILCMAKHQDIQEKVFQEIDRVLGSNAEVRYDEKDKLPYTEATIHECLRYKTLLPLNPYHSCSEDTKFRGYDIPKGSLVFAMLKSIHEDPSLWECPETFHPERFLTPDLSKVRLPEAFMPFGTGRRTCLGDKLALIALHLISVSLVRKFKILPPASGLNMEGYLRISMEPKHSLVKLVLRESAI